MLAVPQSTYFFAYYTRLLTVRIGDVNNNLLAWRIFAVHCFVYLSTVMPDKAVGCVYDILDVSVPFLFQLVLKIQYVVDIGPAKSVNALCVISDNTDVAMSVGQQCQDALLGIVGVLVFIHKHVPKPIRIFLTYFLMISKQSVSI